MNARRFLGPVASLLLAVPALAADVSGAWSGQLTDPAGNTHPITLQLTLAENKVTGTLTGGPPLGEAQSLVNGKLEGDQLSFDVKAQGPGGEIVITYKGQVTGNHIAGTSHSPVADVPWEATKD